MKNLPTTNGDNGRLSNGQFALGNAGGPGNPNAAAVGKWRAALAETVTVADIQKVTAILIAQARAGEAWAIRELFDRTLGKSRQSIEVDANVNRNQYPGLTAAQLEEIAKIKGGPK